MSLANEEDIEEFADDLRELFESRVVKIFLFGSYARDEHVPGSDIDLLVLLEGEVDAEDRREVGELTADYFEDRDLFFSPKLIEISEYREKIEEGYSFHTEVAKQGVEI